MRFGWAFNARTPMKKLLEYLNDLEQKAAIV
jgi:hypothetical protein